MPAFDNPLQTWTARFDREGYLFGETPNAFLRREAARLVPGSRFANWDVLRLRLYDEATEEGVGHCGMSALIDLIARKRA